MVGCVLGLLGPKCLDGVKAGGATGRVKSKEQSDANRHRKGEEGYISGYHGCHAPRRPMPEMIFETPTPTTTPMMPPPNDRKAASVRN